MSNKTNGGNKNKLLKGLLVALPFLSLTLGAEGTKAVTTTKSSLAKKKLSHVERTKELQKTRSERIRAAKKAQLQRASEVKQARFERSRAAKQVRFERARAAKQEQFKRASTAKKTQFAKTTAKATGLVKVSSANQISLMKTAPRTIKSSPVKQARFVKTTAKTNGGVKLPLVRKTRFVKTAEKANEAIKVVTVSNARFKKIELQRTALIKKNNENVRRANAVQAKSTQTLANTNPNKMYARLEAKLNQTLNILKKQAAPKSSPFEAALTNAVIKLGEIFGSFQKQQQEILVREVIKRIGGSGINFSVASEESQSNITPVSRTNASNVQTKTPTVQTKRTDTPIAPKVESNAGHSLNLNATAEEVANYIGFDLNKTYINASGAVSVLVEKFETRNKQLQIELEKIDPDKNPQAFKKLVDELAVLEKQKEALTQRLNMKYAAKKPGASAATSVKPVVEKTKEELELERVKQLEKAQKLEKEKEKERVKQLEKAQEKLLEDASITPVKLNAPIRSPKGSLSDALAFVEDTSLAQKATVHGLLTKGVLSEPEQKTLQDTLLQLSRSARKSAAAIEQKIEEINQKFLEKPNGEAKTGYSKPVSTVFDAWEKPDKDLFANKMQLARDLVKKEYAFTLLVEKERFNRLVASNPADKTEIKATGTALLDFILKARKIANDLSPDLPEKGAERTAWNAITGALGLQKTALEKNEDVVPKKATTKKPLFVKPSGSADDHKEALEKKLAAQRRAVEEPEIK